MLNHYVRTECQAGCEPLAMQSDPFSGVCVLAGWSMAHGASTHFTAE